MNRQDVARLIIEIDRDRARLRKLLLSKDATILTKRSASGDWSIVENVRHLLWAEQRHLGRFLPGRVEWSRVGITAFRGREFADVGTEPTEDVAAVFIAWDEVHGPIRKALKSTSGDVETALAGNHKHLLYHINIIEKLLRT